jgi:hypothetical protein
MNIRKRNLSFIGTTSALSLFAFAGTALAQETTERPDESTITRTSEQNANAHPARSETEARQMATSFGVAELNDIENWKVTNAGTELGEIDRIAVQRDTGELVAVVGLAGVVGLNMKEVAIPLSTLQKAGDEMLSTNMSKEELQQKRDIDPWDGAYTQNFDGDELQ